MEYATSRMLVHATKQILDNWGEDGWELVALVPSEQRPARRLPEASEGVVVTTDPYAAWPTSASSCRR